MEMVISNKVGVNEIVVIAQRSISSYDKIILNEYTLFTSDLGSDLEKNT